MSEKDIILEAEYGWRAELRRNEHQAFTASKPTYAVLIIDPDGKIVESTDSVDEDKGREWALLRLTERVNEYYKQIQSGAKVEKVRVLKRGD